MRIGRNTALVWLLASAFPFACAIPGEDDFGDEQAQQEGPQQGGTPVASCETPAHTSEVEEESYKVGKSCREYLSAGQGGDLALRGKQCTSVPGATWRSGGKCPTDATFQCKFTIGSGAEVIDYLYADSPESVLSARKAACTADQRPGSASRG